MDNYVIAIFCIAILLSGYAHDVRNLRGDALSRVAERTLIAIGGALGAYYANRKRAA